jgi:hypothetical protein
MCQQGRRAAKECQSAPTERPRGPAMSMRSWDSARLRNSGARERIHCQELSGKSLGGLCLAWLSFGCLLGQLCGLWSMHWVGCLVLPSAATLLGFGAHLNRGRGARLESPRTWIVHGVPGRRSWCEEREEVWRREGDSNPRWVLAHSRFPGVRVKPLCHLSDQCALLCRSPSNYAMFFQRQTEAGRFRRRDSILNFG